MIAQNHSALGAHRATHGRPATGVRSTSLPLIMTIAKADYIEGLAKGLAVLEAFDTERQRLNATLCAQRTGITRAAARRHLLTLAALGYLETDGSHYWLSARVLRLAGSYMATSRLPRTLQPTLNRLAAQTQASFSAVVLDGDECVIVARSAGMAEPVRHLAYGLHLGARLPGGCCWPTCPKPTSRLGSKTVSWPASRRKLKWGRCHSKP